MSVFFLSLSWVQRYIAWREPHLFFVGWAFGSRCHDLKDIPSLASIFVSGIQFFLSGQCGLFSQSIRIRYFQI